MQNFNPLKSIERDFKMAYCIGDPWHLATTQKHLKLLKKSLSYEKGKLEDVTDYYKNCANVNDAGEEEDEFTVVNYPYSSDKYEAKALKLSLDSLIYHFNE